MLQSNSFLAGQAGKHGVVQYPTRNAKPCHEWRMTVCATSLRGQPMSTEDKPERPGEEKSAKWHRAGAKRLREHGFTKMAEEHEAIERRRQQEQTK